LKHYLAIDIGASSGRHIVGWIEDGEMHTHEVFRFANGMVQQDGHLVWDTEALFKNVTEGIGKAFAKYGDIAGLSIDTWGVDYVLMSQGKEILPVYAYRDSRTAAVCDEVHSIIPFSRLYEITGCQFQAFNSLYQLYCDKLEGRLDKADGMLMIPEYLMYRLTGNVLREYTNATTTGLIDAESGTFSQEIIAKLGLPERLFPSLCPPGTRVGRLLPQIAEQVGGDCDVFLCATHDTASAVEGIPMKSDSLYISSGTWSLLGAKTDRPITSKAAEIANYSNEGGVGYNRFQKNIMGMWIVNNLKKELAEDLSFDDILALAESSDITAAVDVNAEEFMAPESMSKAFFDSTNGALHTVGDYFRCAFLSLAEGYKKAIDELEAVTEKRYDDIYIVGGGAKNRLLNAMTREATGKNIIALPIEATALGNLKILSEVK